MSAIACPNGHESADSEWCDTCGSKIGGDPSPGSPPASVASPTMSAPASPAVCPHCGELNPSDALFCEVCGYDFTTGQAPPARPVPVPTEPTSEPAIESSVAWIAVVDVDAAWYALKGALADQPCPPASSSTVPLAHHTALVGRSSTSRGVRPEVTLDADTGVSRRHAQFVRDGDSLTVVDLSSTNGTYVVRHGEEPDGETEALVAGVPADLGDGDQVYVGAWSRLTVRSSPATR